MTRTADDLVIGGGLAGAACAAALSAAGHHVILLERDRGPTDRLCGEFLGEEALLQLEALGIDVDGLGAAPIETVRLATGRDVVDHPLGFAARGLSRRVLDEAVRARARAAGADLRSGARVDELLRRDGGWQVRLHDGDVIAARDAFLATGKHDLRGWKRPEARRSPLIGFKQHWRLAPAQRAALAGAVELTLFPGGYAGLAPIDGGRANLCLLVDRSRFDATGRRWGALLAEIRGRSRLLGSRLDGAVPCEDRPLSIAAIPFGLLWQGDGPWRLGDQAAVVPSFTGSGMAVALFSATLAASCHLRGETSGRYHGRLAQALSGPVGRGMRLSPLMIRGYAQVAVSTLAQLAPMLIGWGIGATRVPFVHQALPPPRAG